MTIKTITALREGCASFYRTVLKNPYVFGMAILFVTGKVAANQLLGASWGNALRSGVMGLVLYGLGCLVIHLLSSDPPSAPQPSPVAARRQSIWLLVCYGLITLAVTSEVLGWNLSPWHEILTTWQSWVARWQQIGLSGWPYLLFYIALPIVLFFKSGRLPRLLGWRQSRTALPFVLLYLLAYTVIRGVTLPGLLTLLFVLVWPALGEEFFFRGPHATSSHRPDPQPGDSRRDHRLSVHPGPCSGLPDGSPAVAIACVFRTVACSADRFFLGIRFRAYPRSMALGIDSRPV